MSNDLFGGFDLLEDELKKYMKDVEPEEIIDVLSSGAIEFTDILLKLPSPMSKINKVGYTHLVRSFKWSRNKGQVEVGWGKYYGPMVEHGATIKGKYHKKQPHLMPAWEKNKKEIYQNMIDKIWRI